MSAVRSVGHARSQYRQAQSLLCHDTKYISSTETENNRKSVATENSMSRQNSSVTPTRALGRVRRALVMRLW